MKKLMLLIGTAVGLLASTWAEIKDTDVAAIGETGYGDLQSAVDAAASKGDTVKLLKSIDITSAVEMGTKGKPWKKDLTIDLCTNTLTHTAGGWLFNIGRGGYACTVVISNGNMVAKGNSDSIGIRNNGSKLTLEDVTLEVNGGCLVQMSQGGDEDTGVAPELHLKRFTGIMTDGYSFPAGNGETTFPTFAGTVWMDKESTITASPAKGQYVFDVGSGSAEFHIAGKIYQKETGLGVLNVSNGATGKFYLEDGAELVSDNGWAVTANNTTYLEHDGKITITGKSGGISLGGGSNRHCTIGEGAVVTGVNGAALSIGDGVTDVKITGGTFVSSNAVAVVSTTKIGFIEGGEFKGKTAMPTDYIAPKAGYEPRWVDAATAGYVTPGYVRVFNVTYTTAHGEAPAVKTVYPTLVDEQYKYALTAADLPTLPDADGYVFKGWCIDSQKVEVGTVISADVSLTASWELATVAFTVSWDGTAKISKAYAKVGAAEKSEIQNGETIQVIPGTVVTLSADFTENWIKCPELTDYTVDAATAVTLTTAKIDPSSDITPDTKAADVGITEGAFKEMTGTELGRVVGWAEAKGFSPSDLNNVAFDADGDATTPAAEAYLLNCSAAELEQAKADFKVTAITQNDDGSWTVEVNGKQFNGVVEKVPVEDITLTNGELYRAALRFKPSND